MDKKFQSMSDKKYFWIIGGGQLQVPVVEEARKLELNIIVSDMNPRCICSDLADLFFEISVYDVEGHIREWSSIKDKFEVVGVLAAGIDCPETMAAMNEAIGLRGVSSDVARLVNSKDEFRKWMFENGFATPKFVDVSVSDLIDLESVMAPLRRPVIVKNTNSAGSRGSQYIPDSFTINEIADAIKNAIDVSRSNKALIEEVWTGEEYTVEGIFDVDGVFHLASITHRFFEKRFGYPLETGLMHPASLSYNDQVELHDLALRLASKLGISIGVVKLDVIITPDGPRLIEMTVRLSGGFDSQYVVPLATGKNLVKAAVYTALGLRIPEGCLDQSRFNVVITGSKWPLPGRITKINGINDALDTEGVEHVFVRSEIGDECQSYIDCTRRTCFVISVGVDERQARNQLNKALNKIDYVIEPKEKFSNRSQSPQDRELLLQANNQRRYFKPSSSVGDSEPNYLEKIVPKPWGYEFLGFQSADAALWFLHIESGEGTSLHCHPNKHTSLMVLEGRATCMNAGGAEFHVGPGEIIDFGRGVFHKTTNFGKGSLKLLEIETPIKKNDLIRAADGYGRRNMPYESSLSHMSQAQSGFALQEGCGSEVFGKFQVEVVRVMDFFNFSRLKRKPDYVCFLNRHVWRKNGDLIADVGEIVPFYWIWGNPDVRVNQNLLVLTISKI